MKDRIKKKELFQYVITGIAVLMFGMFFLSTPAQSLKQDTNKETQTNTGDTQNQIVIPEGDVVLPINWNDYGKQMIDVGVIDDSKLISIYETRGGLSDEDLKLLYSESNENIVINKENANYVLNMLWAFGLSNKNDILENGEMSDPKYGGAGNFASTGGWTLAKGNAMDHYSHHQFVTLTEDQQKMVDDISKNIYRPCCGNSTHFPDCNHGMAMLGLLELLVKENLSEEEIYSIALKVNSLWLPSTYETIALYFSEQGVEWKDVDAKEVLGKEYSSGSGFKNILSQVEATGKSGVSCGV